MSWWEETGKKLLKQGKSDSRIYIRCFADAGLDYDKDLIDRKKSVDKNVKAILRKKKPSKTKKDSKQ